MKTNAAELDVESSAGRSSRAGTRRWPRDTNRDKSCGKKRQKKKEPVKLQRLTRGWKLNEKYAEVRQLRKYNASGLTTHGGAAVVGTPFSYLHVHSAATYTHTHTHARTRLPCLPSPPTYIRRNIAAVIAQMASIFVLPVVVGRHVCIASVPCTCNRAARSGDIEASRDVAHHRRKTLANHQENPTSPSMSVTGSRIFFAPSLHSFPLLPAPKRYFASHVNWAKRGSALKRFIKDLSEIEVPLERRSWKVRMKGLENQSIENGYTGWVLFRLISFN